MGRQALRAPNQRVELGGTTCLMLQYLSTTASFVLCVLRCVKDHHNLLQYSSVLKNTCVIEVVLDKWFPLIEGSFPCWIAGRRAAQGVYFSETPARTDILFSHAKVVSVMTWGVSRETSSCCSSSPSHNSSRMSCHARLRASELREKAQASRLRKIITI